GNDPIDWNYTFDLIRRFVGEVNNFSSLLRDVNALGYRSNWAYKWPDKVSQDLQQLKESLEDLQRHLSELRKISTVEQAQLQQEKQKTEKKDEKSPTKISVGIPYKADFIKAQEWVRSIIIPALYETGIFSSEHMSRMHFENIFDYALENALFNGRQAEPE